MADSEIIQATPGKTEQEKLEEKIFQTLTILGGQTVKEDSLTFEGTRFILPAEMNGDITKAIQFLTTWDKQQNKKTEFYRTFPFRPYDGAAAFRRAMKRVFGTEGIGKSKFDFFGKEHPPVFISIPVGPRGQTLQVPWGEIEFSLLEATFELGVSRDPKLGFIFQVSVTCPKRNQLAVEGFFKVVEEELRERSIYKGKAVTSDPMTPEFIDTALVNTAKVVYTEEVENQLTANLWAPIMYSQAMRDSAVPLKRAVLLMGPNGTGKSLTGSLTAQIAERHKWTYILVEAGADPLGALTTARMYAPAVVMVEDIDTWASATENPEALSKVLDVLDGVQAKNLEVMAVFTTNYPELLPKGVVRAGRIDAVIKFDALDAQGYERLIKATIPNHLFEKHIDMSAVVDYLMAEKMLPSFTAEAASRAVRYSISANRGRPGIVTAQNLLDSAKGMKAHLDLMNAAATGREKSDTLDDKFLEKIREGLHAMQGNFTGRIMQFEESDK